MADNGVVKFGQLKTFQSMLGSEVDEEVCQIRYVGVVKFPEVPTWHSIEVVYKTTQTCICMNRSL